MADMAKGVPLGVSLTPNKQKQMVAQQPAQKRKTSILQFLLMFFMIALMGACGFLVWKSGVFSGGDIPDKFYYNPSKEYFFKAYNALGKADLPLQNFHRIQKYVETLGSDNIKGEEGDKLKKELWKVKEDIVAVVSEITKLQNEFEDIEIVHKDGSKDKIGDKTEFSEKMNDIKDNQERGLNKEIMRINQLVGQL